MAIDSKLAILPIIKKILIRPRYLVAVLLVVLALVAGGLYLANRETGPKLSPAQKKSQQKLDNFEDCLTKAMKTEGDQNAKMAARSACLEKYPES